ncbi:hypothetical protein BJF79_14735 [Actinomadura sp. CNU-125]|nr:hypothetical protein BJF79_14735 [Actinomadura sp. CNU-125]
MAGFTATVDDAGLQRGQDRAAWSRVGADARVSAERLRSDAADRLRAVDGVTGVVPARIVPGVTAGDDPAPITLVAVDLDAYRDLAPDVPGLPGTGEAPLSPAAADIVGSGPATLGRYGIDDVRVPAGTPDASSDSRGRRRAARSRSSRSATSPPTASPPSTSSPGPASTPPPSAPPRTAPGSNCARTSCTA